MLCITQAPTYRFASMRKLDAPVGERSMLRSPWKGTCCTTSLRTSIRQWPAFNSHLSYRAGDFSILQ